MATNKIQTSLRLNEPLYDKIRSLAEREQRSINNLIEYALQKYVENYEQDHGALPPPSDAAEL